MARRRRWALGCLPHGLGGEAIRPGRTSHLLPESNRWFAGRAWCQEEAHRLRRGIEDETESPRTGSNLRSSTGASGKPPPELLSSPPEARLRPQERSLVAAPLDARQSALRSAPGPQRTGCRAMPCESWPRVRSAAERLEPRFPGLHDAPDLWIRDPRLADGQSAATGDRPRATDSAGELPTSEPSFDLQALLGQLLAQCEQGAMIERFDGALAAPHDSTDLRVGQLLTELENQQFLPGRI